MGLLTARVNACRDNMAMPKRYDNSMKQTIIECDADVQRGLIELCRDCPFLRTAHTQAGDPPLRRNSPDFRGLSRIIVGQQLSISSAAAIWRRLEKSVKPFEADVLLRKRETTLRNAGLSKSKIKALRASAEAFVAGRLKGTELVRMPEAVVHERLIAIHGIGPWTADIFQMFCLGRADAFAPGDLALQVAVGELFGLSNRPSSDELQELADRWRPWRGVAARLLWAYYGVIKQSGAATPI